MHIKYMNKKNAEIEKKKKLYDMVKKKIVETLNLKNLEK